MSVEQAICLDDNSGEASAPDVSLPENTDQVTYALTGEIAAGETVTVTATPAERVLLTESDGWTINSDGTATATIVLATVDCDITVAPVAPAFTSSVCVDGAQSERTFTGAETEGVTYAVSGNPMADLSVTVTATPKPGFVLGNLPEGWAASEFGTAVLTVVFADEDCPPLPGEATPVAPTVTQAVCSADGSASAPDVSPASTENVTYEVTGELVAGNTVTVTATPAEGFVLTASTGWTLLENGSATFEVALDAVDCPQPIAPVAPAVTQAVCSADGSASAPTVTPVSSDEVAYQVAGSLTAGSTVTVTATPIGKRFLAVAKSSPWTVTEAGDRATMEIVLDATDCAQPVIPVAPTVAQAMCSADGDPVAPSVTLPETPGLTYAMIGDAVAGGSVTVTAVPSEKHLLNADTFGAGWTLADGTATLVIDLASVDCKKTGTPAKPDSKGGLAITGSGPVLPLGAAAALLLLIGAALVARRRAERATA